MIGSIIKEILGLFVDDEVLVIGLPVLLVADVMLTLRRATRT
jgi:hypothetical protein